MLHSSGIRWRIGPRTRPKGRQRAEKCGHRLGGVLPPKRAVKYPKQGNLEEFWGKRSAWPAHPLPRRVQASSWHRRCEEAAGNQLACHLHPIHGLPWIGRGRVVVDGAEACTERAAEHQNKPIRGPSIADRSSNSTQRLDVAAPHLKLQAS